MDVATYFQREKESPEFQALPYEKQLKIRTAAINNLLPQQEAWANAPLIAQQNVHKKLIYQPPRFTNPEFNQMAEQFHQQITAEQASGEKGPATSAIADLVRGEGLLSNNLVFRTVTDIASAIQGKLVNDKQLAAIEAELLTPEQQVVQQAMYGEEAEKFRNYMVNQATLDPRTREAAQSAEMFAGVAGTLLDYGTFALATGGINNAAAAWGVDIAKKMSSPAAMFLTRTAAPVGVDALADGAFGVVREEILRSRRGDPSLFGEGLGKVGMTFGTWAAQDFLIGMGLNTGLAFVGSSARKIYSRNTKPERYAEAAEYTAMLDNVAYGSVDPALLKTQPTYVQDQAWMRQRQWDITNKAAENIVENPIDRTVFSSTQLGNNIFRPLDDGRYRMWMRNNDGILESEIYDSLDSLQKKMADLSWERYDKLPKGEQAEFLKTNDWLINMKRASNGIDTAFDPAKHIELNDKQRRQITKARRKGYVSAADRPYISKIEADEASKAIGPEGFSGFIDVPEDAATRIRKGDNVFGQSSQVVTPGGNNRAYVGLKKVAGTDLDEPIEQLAQRMAKNGNVSIDEARRYALRSHGFDGRRLADGSVEVLYPEKIKVLSDMVDPSTGKLVGIDTDKDITDAVNTATVERAVKARVPKEAIVNENLVANISRRFRERITEPEMNNFVRMYVSNFEGTPNVNVTAKRSAREMMTDEGVLYKVSRKSNGTWDIEVPTKLRTPNEQANFMEGLISSINNHLPDIPKGRRVLDVDALKKAIKNSRNTYRAPFESVEASRRWLSDIINKRGQGFIRKTPDGLYSMKLPGMKRSAAFATLEDAVDYALRHTMDTSSLKQELARIGHKLTVDKSGKLRVRTPYKGQVIEADNIHELMQKMNWRPEKISNIYAPEHLILEPDAITVQYMQGSALGKRGELLNLINNFEDKQARALAKQLYASPKGEILQEALGPYQVHLPKAGITEEFTSLADARKFIETKMDTIDNITNMVARKDLDISFDKGRIVISDYDGTNHIANSYDEALDILGKFPDPVGARSIFPDESSEMVDEISKAFYAQEKSLPPRGRADRYGAPPDVMDSEVAPMLSAKSNAQIWTQQMGPWVENTAKQIDLPELAEGYYDVRAGLKKTTAEMHELEEVLGATFRTPSGKMLSDEAAEKVFFYRGAYNAEELAAAQKRFGPMTPDEQVVHDRLKMLNDRLGIRFGIPPEKMVKNYMPRIRDWHKTANAETLAGITTAEELLGHVYHGDPPADLRVFFENSRASDVLSFVPVANAKKVMHRYISHGVKKANLEAGFQRIYRAINENPAKVPEAVRLRMHEYRDLIMNGQISNTEKMLQTMGESMMRSIFPNSPKRWKQGEDLLNNFYALNYLTNMGWRPWLAHRNTTQIWTTLAPRWGNTSVSDAIKVLSDGSDDIYDYLRATGIITGKAPVLAELATNAPGLNKLTDKALTMFKNSDEYTRAIGFTTAKIKFDDALDKLQRGVIRSREEFAHTAGIDLLGSEVVQRRILDGFDFNNPARINQETIDGARLMYGGQVSDETFFLYQAAENPKSFQGVIGKAFGRYGTYSVGYRANLVHGLTRGTAAQRFGFGMRFLGNQMALWAGFSVLGINAANYVPFAPAIFTGGPMFDLGVNTLRSFGSGYEADQARAAVKRDLLSMPPGALQVRYINKALKYADEGDSWRAFLSLTSTPTISMDRAYKQMPFLEGLGPQQ